mmetsp:Transcript_14409/g.34237  ORF Transcript_14409/g.34237 Transcript_14409/m.34237 type:complete len:487 (+) Transcript_14409:251-1711(+)
MPSCDSSTEIGSHEFYEHGCSYGRAEAMDVLRELSAAADDDRGVLVPREVRRRATIRRVRLLGLCCSCLLLFPTFGTIICITSYMAGSRNPVLLMTMGLVLPRYTYYIENMGLLAAVVRLVDPRAAASHARASAYYHRQRPIFEAAAKSWVLHPYFAEQGTAPEFQRMESTLYDTVIGRLRVMGAQLRALGRDDFRIEKDKCKMYSFFQRNRLPTVHVLNVWYTHSEFLDQMYSGVAFQNTSHWPVFIKFCHLTQGSMLSTRRIKSNEYLHQNWKEIVAWVDSKWNLHADDITRPWREYSNELTDFVPPGVLVQLPANLSYNPVRKKWGVVEVKVEVVWGRAYLGALLPDDDSTEFPVVMRGSNDTDGVIEVFDSYFSVVIHRGVPLSPDVWYAWVLEPGYLNCAWKLAERSAAIMRADQVRIDIFITEGQPDNCLINEDSLSSGQNYGPHTHFLNLIWLEPWVHKWFKTAKLTAPYTPVYDQIIR